MSVVVLQFSYYAICRNLSFSLCLLIFGLVILNLHVLRVDLHVYCTLIITVVSLGVSGIFQLHANDQNFN